MSRGRVKYPSLVCLLTDDEPVRYATGPVDGFCPHHHPLRMGYLSWDAEAARRYKAKNRQRQCPDCSKYLWPDEVGERGER